MFFSNFNMMNSLWRRINKPVYILRLLKQEIASKPFQTFKSKNVNNRSIPLDLYPKTVYYSATRYKSKKAQYDSDDDEDFTADSTLSKDSKVVKFSTTSMRADLIIKSALGIARNKIEQQFYESRIRINGKKILKKSASVRSGDEIDIVKMVSPKNSDHLYVSRIEILNVAIKDEAIAVTARRFKNLLIENYEADPYKGGSESESKP